MSSPKSCSRTVSMILLTAVVLCCSQCSQREPKRSGAKPLPSEIQVKINPNGPLVVNTSAAEFHLLSSGSIQGFLLKNGAKLTLDSPRSSPPNLQDHLVSGGKAIGFTADFSQVRVLEAQGKLGRGKRIEIPFHATDNANHIQRTLVLEAYDDLPNIVLTSTRFENSGSSDARVDEIVTQSHALSAALSPAKSAPYDMWSFHGSSEDWGKDDVIKLSKGFSQENVMGAIRKGGYGGGIPVVAFWTGNVGEAIGHI